MSDTLTWKLPGRNRVRLKSLTSRRSCSRSNDHFDQSPVGGVTDRIGHELAGHQDCSVHQFDRTGAKAPLNEISQAETHSGSLVKCILVTSPPRAKCSVQHQPHNGADLSACS